MSSKRNRPYQLVVVLDAEDKERLDEAAAREKASKADTVRRAIREHLLRLQTQKRVAS